LLYLRKEVLGSRFSLLRGHAMYGL